MNLTADIAFWCAVVPAALFLWNLFYFRRPSAKFAGGIPPRISVLIPARNEEHNIGAAVESVLASRGVDLELIVLDDGSTDRTARIVDSYAVRDARVRCVAGKPLQPGWAGKAHAAHGLATLARHDTFCFLDADVRIAPDALARMHGFMLQTGSEFVSGFPEEITLTPMEWLLLPLIQFLLLGYLPLAGMRHTNMQAFGAGCGQFLMMRRAGYEATGGYAAVPATMHDGMTLAKLFRGHGCHTDVADLTGLAQCRMYSGGYDVWNGLMKNATEGIAAPGRIVPFTLLLFLGQVLPWLLLAYALAAHRPAAWKTLCMACFASLLPRLVSLLRFNERWMGAILHPVAIAVFLVLQWWALMRKFAGTQVSWKGRAFDVG